MIQVGQRELRPGLDHGSQREISEILLWGWWPYEHARTAGREDRAAAIHSSLHQLQKREPWLREIGSLWEGLSCSPPGMGLEREERPWVAEAVWALVSQTEAGGPSPGIQGEAVKEEFFQKEWACLIQAYSIEP